MSVEERVQNLEQHQQRIEDKLDQIMEILESKVSKNCEKMSEHIDFIDTVYDNVKNPLGFICNKVGSIMGSSENYAIADKEKVTSGPNTESSV